LSCYVLEYILPLCEHLSVKLRKARKNDFW
jgi:hypothetical protein